MGKQKRGGLPIMKNAWRPKISRIHNLKTNEEYSIIFKTIDLFLLGDNKIYLEVLCCNKVGRLWLRGNKNQSNTILGYRKYNNSCNGFSKLTIIKTHAWEGDDFFFGNWCSTKQNIQNLNFANFDWHFETAMKLAVYQGFIITIKTKDSTFHTKRSPMKKVPLCLNI